MLRHKATDDSMNFFILAEQSYQVFNFAKWLNPFIRAFSRIYSDNKSMRSFFEAKFDEHGGCYEVKRVPEVGDDDSYMSIKAVQ